MIENSESLEDPIEIILEMARRGEIDPWNVDVVDITDRFLRKLEKAKELDLRVSGRVLLYAAILVRMKAEAIAFESLKIEDEVQEEDITFEDFVVEDILDESYLEEELAEVLKTPRRRIRRISTLKDLIEELKRAEIVERRRKKRKRKDLKEVDVDRTLRVPHEESMEETIALIERELKAILSKKQRILFSSVVRGKKKEEIVDYYLSLMHLVFRRKIEIYQKEFYGDIEIREWQ